MSEHPRWVSGYAEAQRLADADPVREGGQEAYARPPKPYARPPKPYARPPKPAVEMLEPETVVHLVQLVRYRGHPTFFTWCGATPDVAAFEPRVVTCAKCILELHEAVSQ